MRRSILSFWQIHLAILGFSLVSVYKSAAVAQVTSDGTVNTQVEQNGNSAEITGGETRGSNLFHSFQDFSVQTGNEAFFDNANDVSNIFSRVTGGNISNIDGAIRANGSSNLFLINPAGILFGEGARLDLGGSFYGSTASSILFEDGEFSAADLENPPLLTVNAPIGLGFRDNPADITVRGDGNGTRLEDSEPIDTQDALRVSGDATIGFIGGNINFESATVKTAGGSIEVGSVGSGEVGIAEAENGFTFDYSEIENLGDISLGGTFSVIDASGNGGGNINVSGRNISINDSSGIEANTLGDEVGGDINIFATDAIEISGVENENNFISAISNRVFADATAEAGNINIETGSLSLGDRSAIATSSSGQGNAGNIQIDTSSLSASNGALINTSNGAGRAGNLNINATGDVSFANSSILFTSGVPGGSMSINARNLSILSGGTFFAGVVASGISEEKSGDVVINLTEDLTIDQLDTDSSTSIDNSSFGEGDAGNIEVNARNITFNNGGIIISGSNGEGDVGSITLNASDNITFDGIGGIARSGILNAISPNSTGNIGAINITAQNLSLTNGAIIQSLVGGIADSGNLNLDIADTIMVDGFENMVLPDGSASNVNSLISSNVVNGVGNAGNINIDTTNLLLSRNGNISTNVTQGQGNAGDININAEVITIGEQGNTSLSPSNISSEVRTGLLEGNPFLEANSGNIIINTDILDINDGGSIEVSAVAIGNAGNITINANESISINGMGTSIDPSTREEFQSSADITARILGGIGNSGNIEINTANFSLTNDADVDTSNAGEGNAGSIIINANDALIENDASINSISASTDEISREGNSGSIEINSTNLSLIQDSIISTTSNNLGNAGDIIVNVTESLTLDDESVISSNVFNSQSLGNGGNLEINTVNLNINNESEISAVTQSRGNGGLINIDVDNLSIAKESSINAFTERQGNAGSISINANEFIQVDGNFSFIRAGTIEGSTGNGGNLTIETNRLSVVNGAQISTGSSGLGNSGNLIINANESIELSGDGTGNGRSGLFASALNEDGNGGDLEIFTQDLIILDGATINVSNFPSIEGIAEPGTGGAGNLTVEANSLRIEEGGRINAATQSGNGGNINLDIAENITLRETGFISARALGDANGGNINIDTNFIVAFPQGNNDIIANAERGNGGNININAESLFGIEERALNSTTNDINASSEFSLDGSININTPDLNPVQGATELPSNVVETGETTAQACQRNREIDSESENGLTVKGKGGVPPAPELALDSRNIVINGENTNSISEAPQEIKTSKGKIQPARGINVTESGEVILTAHRTNNSGDRIPAERSCS